MKENNKQPGNLQAENIISFLVGANGYPHLLSLLTRMPRDKQKEFIISCMEMYGETYKPVNPPKEQEETESALSWLQGYQNAYDIMNRRIEWQSSQQSGHIKNLHKMLAAVNEVVKQKDKEINLLRNALDLINNQINYPTVANKKFLEIGAIIKKALNKQ